ncbi:MAG: LLM class F420-dependent oxidoreductase [Candidatus Promineifilaceae bacterium]|jgi:probable F420-dependent oxidoreductase
MTNIRIGVQLHPQHTTYESFATAVQQVEVLGVDTIWNWDHFYPLYGPKDGPHFEAWTLLTAMAMLTERAEIGCLVTCNSYRNPALLTHMAKTVDHISNGRLILGIGAGWFERDYDEFGYEFGSARDRLRDLAASLPIIQERMAAEDPPPVRNPIPLLIGGGGEKVTLKLTAQYADMWNSFGPPEKWVHKNQVLTDWCIEIGRDPAAIERTVHLNSEFDPAALDTFAAAGATHFIVGLGDPWDYGLVERLLAWRS